MENYDEDGAYSMETAVFVAREEVADETFAGTDHYPVRTRPARP